MKRILSLTVVLVMGFAGFHAAAQGVSPEVANWAEGWKHAFSKEGVKEWKPEFTARYRLGVYTSGQMLCGGVRIDEKRTFSLFINHADFYLDYAPGNLYTIGTGINFRRYWHFGKRKIFALYSDLYAGAGWIYKIKGRWKEAEEKIDDNVGDIQFIGGWQPGIRIRCYRNLHIFLGPVLATDCLGGTIGIGF